MVLPGPQGAEFRLLVAAVTSQHVQSRTTNGLLPAHQTHPDMLDMWLIFLDISADHCGLSSVEMGTPLDG
jgi:hypothetical protein